MPVAIPVRSTTALAGALISVSLAATGLGSPATANATCLSISGINIGSGCTSGLFGLAIGLGAGATANAAGFSSSFAIGDGSTATGTGALNTAVALGPASLTTAIGFLNTAVAVGLGEGSYYTEAQAGYAATDFANLAVTLGKNSYAFAGGPTPDSTGAGNIALNLGLGNDIEAFGFLNGALGLGGTQPDYPNNAVYAGGIWNSASSIGGNANRVLAGSLTGTSAFANSAFNAFGSTNTVTAGPGPVTLAGALFTSGSTVTKTTFGVAINGVRLPNTAAAVPAAKAAAAHRGPLPASATAAPASAAKPAPASAVKPTRGTRD